LIFADLDFFAVDGDICRGYIRPAARVEIIYFPSPLLHRLVGMSAKNIVESTQACIENRSRHDFFGISHPELAFSFDIPADSFVFEINELNEIVYFDGNQTKERIVNHEVVELMSVNSHEFFAPVPPSINAVHFRAGEGGQNFGEILVVISRDPAHFPRLGKLRDESEKFPVVAPETVEIEIFKNISEQDQLFELEVFQKFRRFFGTAHPRSQMQIGNDDRVGFVASSEPRLRRVFDFGFLFIHLVGSILPQKNHTKKHSCAERIHLLKFQRARHNLFTQKIQSRTAQAKTKIWFSFVVVRGNHHRGRILYAPPVFQITPK
jgi:hypothetical protein